MPVSKHIVDRPTRSVARRPCRTAWLLVAALALGCGGEEPVAWWTPSERLIAEPTDQVLDLKSLHRSYGYLTWSFEHAGEEGRWKTPDEVEPRIVDGYLEVPASGTDHRFVRLSREVNLDAEKVRSIEVEARDLRRGDTLRLFWAPPGEGYVAERGTTVVVEADAELPSTYRFAVREHPLWKGRVQALRLDVPSVQGRSVWIRRIATLGREGFESELLARLVGQDWKVELGHEARNAVLTPPGVPRQWQLPEAASGRLSFAFGLPAGAGPAITFRIARGADGPALFEETLAPGDAARAGRWLERTLELTGVEELVLTADVAEPGERERYRIDDGLPVWGHPEILVPGDEPRRPNVVLISLDTLRADRLGVYGYSEPTSPNIDRWAKERAVTFRRAVATAPWTLPSHASILSGLDALSHGVNHDLAAPTDLVLLPEILRRAGYATLAVTGGGWLHPDKGLAQGFDVFSYRGDDFARADELTVGLDRALGWLASHRKRQLFLFFHTYEIHDPYRHRRPFADRCSRTGNEEVQYGAAQAGHQRDQGFRTLYEFRKWPRGEGITSGRPISAEDLPLISCRYDSGIAYVDRHLAKLFERLAELELDRETLVVLTSDHGESLGEYGYVKHAYLLDSNLLVPLIIALPDGRYAGRAVDAQVSTVDVVPTVLDLLGLAAESEVDGESLLPLMGGGEPNAAREAWSYAGSSNFGVSLRVDDRLKYVFDNTAWPSVVGGEELYDLRADAEERTNVAADSPRQVESLRAKLTGHLRAHAHGVRLSFASSGCGAITGRLTGLAMHILRIKADSPPPPSGFDWLSGRTAAFRVAPGESFDVLAEAARGSLTVTGEAAACGGRPATPFRATVGLGSLEDSWRLSFDGTVWSEPSAAPEDEVAYVALRRVGRQVVSETADDPVDPALIEQLRALGYVN